VPRTEPLRPGVGLAAALAAGVLLLALRAPDALAQGRAVPVEASKVEVGPLQDEITAVGNMISNESVIVRPEIDGRIVQISFEEGQPVDKGTELFRLDDDLYQAQVSEAQARLQLSERNFARAKQLSEKGSGTARARDEALSSLQVDKATLALAQARLEKTRIKAPFSGIMGLRTVSIGDYVTAGQDLVNLENIDPVKVDFRVPELFLPGLSRGQDLVITVDAFPGREFRGKVYALDPRIDAAGRSIAVRAKVPNHDKVLRPGLFARVKLILSIRDNAITVPEQSVVPRGADRFVFRVVDGTAHMTKVTLGMRRKGRVEVVDGLQPGDVVVTAGQLKIRDGVPVEVIEPQDEAGPAGASGTS
jgi:membrane fusion protein (multidrug efflux system)